MERWSQSLTAANHCYDTTRWECLAVVCTVLLLGPYLEGTKSLVHTDTRALRCILDLGDAAGKLAQWKLSLSKFGSKVVHRVRVIHLAPSTFSKIPTEKPNATLLDF